GSAGGKGQSRTKRTKQQDRLRPPRLLLSSVPARSTAYQKKVEQDIQNIENSDQELASHTPGGRYTIKLRFEHAIRLTTRRSWLFFSGRLAITRSWRVR